MDGDFGKEGDKIKIDKYILLIKIKVFGIIN